MMHGSFSFFVTFLFLSFVSASHPFQRLADSSTGGTSTSKRAQLASADIVLNQGSSVAVGDIDLTLTTRNADLSVGDTISITLPGYSGVTGDVDVTNIGSVSWNQMTHILNINLSRSFPTSTSQVKITIPTSITSTWNLKSPVIDAGKPSIGLKLANTLDTVVYVNPTTAPLPSGTTCTLHQSDGTSITFAHGQTLVVACETCACKDTIVTCTKMETCGVAPSSASTQAPGTSVNIGTDTSNLPSRCTPGDAVIVIGCNKCTCLSTGDRICAYQLGCVNPPTQAVVATPTQTSGVCMYDGREYTIRSVWNATDGCNACTCSSTLRVVCTVTACDTIITATAAPVITPLPPTSLPVPDTPTGLPISGTGNGIGVAGTNAGSHVQLHPITIFIITLITMIITIVTHL